MHISKHSLFRFKITVGCCAPCTCPSIRVCVVCAMLCAECVCVMCVRVCVCVCGVCNVCCVCVCVLCVCVCVCVQCVCVCCVLLCAWCCVLCVCVVCLLCVCVVCCVLCVGVHCVCVCGVCVRGVCGARLGTRKTVPCVGSRRLHVYWQNARMCSTCARFARTHGGLFEPTHGDVLNLHTGDLSLSSPSLFLSSFLLSLFLRSLPSYFSRSLSLLSSLLSSLSATMTMITRPFGSLCVNTALTCLSVRVPVLRHIPCLANMFVSCKKQLSWYDSASLVPLGMK